MKTHVALKHTVQLCHDAGLEIYDVLQGVTEAKFLSQLHIVNAVLASLQAHNYSVMPACSTFQVLLKLIFILRFLTVTGNVKIFHQMLQALKKRIF